MKSTKHFIPINRFTKTLVLALFSASIFSCKDDSSSFGDAPEIPDQTFTIAEHSAPGIQVGKIFASDPDGDQLTFSISSGNISNSFAIDLILLR